MQWLSIYGDSKSSLSEILLDSGERLMGLFLCRQLVGGVSIVNKIATGVKETSSASPCLALTSCWDEREASSAAAPGSKSASAACFCSILAFPSDSFFHIFTLTFLFAATSCHPYSLGGLFCFQNFQGFFLLLF